MLLLASREVCLSFSCDLIDFVTAQLVSFYSCTFHHHFIHSNNNETYAGKTQELN